VLIFRSKRKHNRVDAQKLAKILYLDEVPKAHVQAADVRSWRATIEWRQGIRHSPTLRAFLQRVKHDDPERKKIALVATAHHLLRAMAATEATRPRE